MRASFPQKAVDEIDEPQDPNPVSKAMPSGRVDSLDEHDKLLDQNPARKEVGTESSESQDIRKTEQHQEDSVDEPEELLDQHSAEEEVSGTRAIWEVTEQHRKSTQNPFRALMRKQNDQSH